MITEFYNEQQISEILGVSVRWLQVSRQAGDGPPFVKIGRLVRYRPEDLAIWADSRLRNNTSEGRGK